MIANVTKYKGRVFLVRLTCDDKELARGLRDPSRKAFRKLQNVQALRKIRKTYRLDVETPFGESLTVDTTKRLPAKTARLIKKHYEL